MRKHVIHTIHVETKSFVINVLQYNPHVECRFNFKDNKDNGADILRNNKGVVSSLTIKFTMTQLKRAESQF